MPKTKLEVAMGGKSAGLESSLKRVRALEERLEKKLKDVGGASRQAAKEQTKFCRDGQRLVQRLGTPYDKHLDRVKRLGRALKAGGISQAEYNRAVGQSEEKFRRASEAGRKAFGGPAVSDLAKFTAGFASLSTVIGTITSGLNEMAAARREAAEQARTSRMSAGALAQVARSPEDFRYLKRKGDELFAAAGAGSPEEAYATIFSLRSAGAMKHFNLFKRLRASGLIAEPGQMVTSAQTMIASMGIKETGDVRALLSKAFGAAAPVSGVSAESILRAAARAGTGAAALKISDEQLLAATGIVSEATGGADLGGTQVASLMKSLQKIGAPGGGFNLKGKSLLQMLETVESRGLDDAALMQLFGRQEAVNAYRVILQNRQKLATRPGGIARAQAENLVDRLLGFHKIDPSLVAARKAEEATAAEAVSRQRLGSWENFAEAQWKRKQTWLRKEGASEWEIWGQGVENRLARWIGGPERQVRGTMTAESMRAVDLMEGRMRKRLPPPPPSPFSPNYPGGPVRQWQERNPETGEWREVIDGQRQANRELQTAAQKLGAVADQLQRNQRPHATLVPPNQDR
jgi:hypothetical protein